MPPSTRSDTYFTAMMYRAVADPGLATLMVKTSKAMAWSTHCVRLCPAKYLSWYIGKYLQTYPRLRADVRQQIYRELRP